MPSIIVELLLQGFLEFACYFVGRIIVSIVSIGSWRCDHITANVARRKIRAAGFYRLRGQQVYLTVEATQLVGFLTILLFVGGGVLIWYLGRA